MMRIRAVVMAAVLAAPAVMATASCGGSGSGGSGLFRQYQYEEEIDLSLDGTATVYVNASIPALNALRGASLDTRPNARIDTAAVRTLFSSPVTHVTRVSMTRRNTRQFVHVRLDAENVEHLSDAAPFAWSVYTFKKSGDLYHYEQAIGPPSGKDVGPMGNIGWNGQELVAFRLHLPSKITYHNTRRDIGRGNILVWEQPLADRLRGAPVKDAAGREIEKLEAFMEAQSILYRTLWLFGWTLVAAAATFAFVIWLIVRRGRKTADA